MVVHAFNPSTQEAEAGRSFRSWFDLSLVYRASSRAAKAVTWRNTFRKRKEASIQKLTLEVIWVDILMISMLALPLLLVCLPYAQDLEISEELCID